LVSIKIENRQTPHAPGETLEGEYQVDAVEPAELRALELAVLWYTEGKGDEDLGVHYFERRTDEDEEPSPLSELRKFTIALPNSPLSYEGVLIKLRWCVRVRVFLKSGRQYFAELPFRLGLVPDARAVLPSKAPDTNGEEVATAAQGAPREEG
jgi:hypothetical protein